MSKNLKAASLAAAIALAMGSTAAWGATAPSATQLPGKGAITSTTGTGVSGTVDATTSTMSITTGGGNSVITWGSGSAINPNGVAGFNVGHDATVNFTGGGAVLNIDSTSNPSQILGTMTSDGSLYVANKNGIIVGKDASITTTATEGALGLIANQIDATTFGSQTGLAYNGTGGDVTVADGATLSGSSVLVTGGGTVNVGLSNIGGTLALSAGLPANGGSFADKNSAAKLVLTGDHTAAAGDTLASAGNASSAGKLDLSATTKSVAVAGTFTNTGTLTLPATATFTGGLVNNNTVEGAATSLTVNGALTNNGEMGKAAALGSVTAGKGLTNAGTLTAGAISVTKGGLTNNGVLNSSGAINLGIVDDEAGDGTPGGDFVNNGAMTVGGDINVYGGSFNNAGSIKGALTGSSVSVRDGSLTNAGVLNNFYDLETSSASTDAAFKAGADYSVKNTGSVISGDDIYMGANAYNPGVDTDNDSTGSVSNTGTLSVGTASGVELWAQNDVTLDGAIKVGGKAISASNPLDYVELYADDYATGNGGTATLNIPVFANDTELWGSMVKVMANVTGTGDSSRVYLEGGPQSSDDYAIRVAKGVTVAADSINVAGMESDPPMFPNVILQGTLAGNAIDFYGVSDVFSGPTGGLTVTGDNPSVEFDFTGRIKTAPYLNASNFRYNGLPINFDASASGPLSLTLNPVAYDTNGTNNGLAAVNILVNGSVNLSQSGVDAFVQPNGTAVTGITNIPNTHLVLQSTGDITTGTVGSPNFYWPGYVYLGTVDADADGHGLPGTLGLGSISALGDFNNALPGDVAGASGIHFMTQFPVNFGGDVVTNANAWVNFATDVLTKKYIAANAADPFMYGGMTSATSNVVTYGELDENSIHTHPVDSSK